MRRTRSLFGEVSQLVASEDREPREDRLTESFAAVLRRVPELGYVLAKLWLDPRKSHAGSGERVSGTEDAWVALDDVPTLRRVRTQVRVHGGRVDLELRFAPTRESSADGVVVRVENKHGDHPRHKQLRTYQETMPANGHPHAVVLLAPRRQLPYGEWQVPDGVPQRSWQTTARAIERYETDNRVGQWLRDEFCGYLDEEQLMDPQALRPEHLDAPVVVVEVI